MHVARNVDQHSVSQIDGIVQTENQAGRAKLFRVVFENPFTSQARLRILAARGELLGLRAAAPFHSYERIDISRREDDDARIAEVSRHVGGD